MANPYQRQARWRKVVYFVAIVVLFTGALLHRHLVVEPMANELQLRESARGEVELTSSAVRLLMTGSRGIASTFLWSAAIEKQKKHEWNEVELLVASITKLQPNFIVPWMFQSWNLAFNVSVECDRPKDKYYYVTRGIDLLAEGERRNRGSGVYPGNPEIRQTIGIFYLRKIGLSDEKTTMRCLLDLSCTDPLLRNPQWFADPQRPGAIDSRELARFCQENPRLVRRLREGLEYANEKDIVDFLKNNRDVPSRFEAPNWLSLPATAPELRQSKLKEQVDQFPILPPAKQGESEIATWPADYRLSNESLDVFLMARSWIEYSVQPLPPPMPDEDELRDLVKSSKGKYRLPKQMALVIFRSYPARCQAYIAENMEEEGWFDRDGWVITKWFDRDPGLGDGDFRVGADRKYHAQPAWDRAAELYYKYGIGNDLLLPKDVVDDLDKEATPYRKKYRVEKNATGPKRSDDSEALQKSRKAHHRPIWSQQNRAMTNFDNHYYAAVAERTTDCVTARKLLHRTQFLRANYPEQAIEVYEQVWPYWTNVFLQNPKFASQSMVQEDLYEHVLKAVRLTQKERAGIMRPIVADIAQMGIWPHPPLEQLMSPTDKSKVFPIRNVRGPLDWIQVRDSFSDGKATDQEIALTRYVLAVWPMAPAGYPALLQPPAVANLMLSRTRMRDEPVPTGWRHLIEEANVQAVRERLGVNKK